MSKENKKYTVAEIWEGYEKYGIWVDGELAKLRDDAPEWLKKKWKFKQQQRKDGIKV